MSSYTYNPLRYPNEFRLIKISRGNVSRLNSEPLGVNVELVHECVDREPPYEAISYVWGDPTKSSTFHLANKRTLPIIETLRHLLPRVINASKTTYLWIDQLCINQESFPERSQQVTIMADIYKNAERTFAWLGESNRYTQIITDIARSLGSQDYSFAGPSEIKAAGKENERLACNYLRSKCTEKCLLHGTAPRGSRSLFKSPGTARTFDDCGFVQGLKGLSDIFQQPWFLRCWIVQEAVLSKSVCMMLGESMFAPDELLLTSTYVTQVCPDTAHKMAPSIWEEGSGWHPFSWLFHLKGKMPEFYGNSYWSKFTMLLGSLRSVAAGGLPDLTGNESYLSQTRIRANLGVTEKKDVIYAFRGLHPAGQRLITPDYKLTDQQVFIDATRACIEETGDLLVLGFCDKIYNINRVDNLPSWVPDWSTRIRMFPLTSVIAKFNTFPGDWSFKSSGKYKHKTEQRSVDPRLHVKGRLVETISAIHPRRFEDFDPHFTTKDKDPFQVNAMVKDMTEGCDWRLKDVSEERILLLLTLKRRGLVKEYHEGSLGGLENVLHHARWRRVCRGRQDEGAIGLVPSPSVVGDQVWVLHGCPTPVVLRKKSRTEFMLVGACYWEGMMDRETCDWRENDASDIQLV